MLTAVVWYEPTVTESRLPTRIAIADRRPLPCPPRVVTPPVRGEGPSYSGPWQGDTATHEGGY